MADRRQSVRLKILLRGFLPTLLTVVLFVAACGEDEMSSPQKTTVQGSTPVLEELGAAFLDLLTQGLESTYKVTYRTITPEGDEHDTYVIVNRPPLGRVDLIPPDPSDLSSIIIGGDEESATVSCSGHPGEWECFEIQAFRNSILSAAGPIIFFTATDLVSFDVSETEGRTLTGQAARCFRLTPRGGAADEDAEYCLNMDGVPLYARGDFGTVEATEFSVEVSEQDFVPPVEPQR